MPSKDNSANLKKEDALELKSPEQPESDNLDENYYHHSPPQPMNSDSQSQPPAATPVKETPVTYYQMPPPGGDDPVREIFRRLTTYFNSGYKFKWPGYSNLHNFSYSICGIMIC